MEQIKALIAVIFFFASLVFASPIFEPRNNNNSPTSKRIKTNNQFAADSMTINQTQYNFQPDAKFDFVKE